jgi:hypothetical protein
LGIGGFQGAKNPTAPESLSPCTEMKEYKKTEQ